MVVWEWASVTAQGWIILALFIVLAIAPIVIAWRQRIPISLAIVISLLLCWVLQSILQIFDGSRDFLTLALAVNPEWQTDPMQSHRLITAGWLHAVGRDGGLVFQHVLGNVLVIALVGVPLEQRLGRERFLAIYLIGVVAGNLAWWFSHWGEFRLALGASGAAFGLLGCYLACWPRDEIEFPIVLIRKWPVSLIALLKLGLEIAQVGMLWGGWTSTSSIAHLAHVGGFFVCYAIGRPIARSGPTPLEVRDAGPSAGSAQKSEHLLTLSKMGSVLSDPWTKSGKELDGLAGRTLERLKEQGDEIETRIAWLEELSEQATCPECDSPLKYVIQGEIPRLECSESGRHLKWP